MKRALTEEEIESRADKLADWITWIYNRYADTISREESAGAPSGFAEPRTIRRGGVEWIEPDPYSQDVHIGVQVNESAASKKAHQWQIRDREIEKIDQHARIRAGEEAMPDRAMSNYLRTASRPYGLLQVQQGLFLLKTVRPSLYERLPSRTALRATVILMHRMVRGRFPNPPA